MPRFESSVSMESASTAKRQAARRQTSRGIICSTAGWPDGSPPIPGGIIPGGIIPGGIIPGAAPPVPPPYCRSRMSLSAAATSRSSATTATAPMALMTAALSTLDSGPATAASAAAARTRTLIDRLFSPRIRTTSAAVAGVSGPSEGSIVRHRDAIQSFSTATDEGVGACGSSLRMATMAGTATAAIRCCSSTTPFVASTCLASPTHAAIRTAFGNSAFVAARASTAAAGCQGFRSTDCNSPISSIALTRTAASASSLPASDSMNDRQVLLASSAAFSLVMSASRYSRNRFRTRSIVVRLASRPNCGSAISSRNPRAAASNAPPPRIDSL